jgi:hypothetical protein
VTDPDKAYIAGIIDGEGSIMLTKFHKNQHPSPCISIASTSIELLDWIKARTGYGNIKSKKNYNTFKHQDSFVYTVKYNDAIKLLNDIIQYLIIPQKKQRAELILSEYKNITPRNGRYSNELLLQKQVFYEKFISL